MPGPEAPHSNESHQEINFREIKELKKYGMNILQAARLTNTVVEEIAQEQNIAGKIHFKHDVDKENRLIGGRFYYKTEARDRDSYAELAVFMPLQINNEVHTNPDETIFSVDTSSYRGRNIISSHSIQKWDLQKLIDREEKEKFKTNIKKAFNDALDKAREAEPPHNYYNS